MPYADFTFRFERWFTALATPLGTGPGRSGVRIADGTVEVRMGWAFRAAIPLSAIRSAELDHGWVGGWGVHGFGGRWLVNGSAHGLVRLVLEPRCPARAALFPVRLRELRLSLAEPEAFLGAIRAPRCD